MEVMDSSDSELEVPINMNKNGENGSKLPPKWWKRIRFSKLLNPLDDVHLLHVEENPSLKLKAVKQFTTDASTHKLTHCSKSASAGKTECKGQVHMTMTPWTMWKLQRGSLQLDWPKLQYITLCLVWAKPWIENHVMPFLDQSIQWPSIAIGERGSSRMDGNSPAEKMKQDIQFFQKFDRIHRGKGWKTWTKGETIGRQGRETTAKEGRGENTLLSIWVSQGTRWLRNAEETCRRGRKQINLPRYFHRNSLYFFHFGLLLSQQLSL